MASASPWFAARFIQNNASSRFIVYNLRPEQEKVKPFSDVIAVFSLPEADISGKASSTVPEYAQSSVRRVPDAARLCRDPQVLRARQAGSRQELRRCSRKLLRQCRLNAQRKERKDHWGNEYDIMSNPWEHVFSNVIIIYRNYGFHFDEGLFCDHLNRWKSKVPVIGSDNDNSGKTGCLTNNL